jgi:hypothetical protein
LDAVIRASALRAPAAASTVANDGEREKENGMNQLQKAMVGTLAALSLGVAVSASAHGPGGPDHPGGWGGNCRHGGLIHRLLDPCGASCRDAARACETTARSEALSCAQNTCAADIASAQSACASDRKSTACQDAVGALKDCLKPCLDTLQSARASCHDTKESCRDACRAAAPTPGS